MSLSIGLALGGGGARGAAHIGVLQILHENGIRFDSIAGTSAGSIIGAMYASKQDPKWIEQRFHKFLNSDDFQAMGTHRIREDQYPDSAMGQMAKYVRDRIVLVMSQQKSFIIKREKLERAIDFLIPAKRFDDLTIPLFVTTTDLHSGEQVLYDHGNLIDAVVQSCTIPGYVQPTERGEQVLVDGAVIDPIPVEIMKSQMDYVLAISITKNSLPDMKKKNLHLYIRRIFITDECPNLLPEYFRFIDGVVDSSDLPLNVSRETLQDNPAIEKIQKNLVRKIISTLTKVKEKTPDKYEGFFKELGRFIKEGVHSDYSNKEKLQELLLFETMKNDVGKLVSLKEYVDNMPSDQKEIYYIIGENRSVLENSPHLEIFRSKGYDVLYMTDPIDEFVVMGMMKYGEKTLKAVGKGEIDFDTEEEKKVKKEKEEKAKKEFSSLLEYVQRKLDENIKEVRFSKRLTDSACCLVGDAYDQSPYMERIMKSMNQDMPKTKRILELNPDHPIVSSMKKLYEIDPESGKLGEFSELLYDQALLAEGSPIANPLQFSKKVADLMVLGLNDAVNTDKK